MRARGPTNGFKARLKYIQLEDKSFLLFTSTVLSVAGMEFLGYVNPRMHKQSSEEERNRAWSEKGERGTCCKPDPTPLLRVYI